MADTSLTDVSPPAAQPGSLPAETAPAASSPALPPRRSRWRRVLRWGVVGLVVAFSLVAICTKDYIRTLQSLRRVPGTNAYVMDYYVDYHIDEIRERGMDVTRIEDSLLETLFPDFVMPAARRLRRAYLPHDISTTDADHHCSTVGLRSGDGEVFFGRNFDWHHDACLILRVHDGQGVASISVLDLAYLNLDREDLDQSSLLERIPLLLAPYYLMDGMNRHGVAVADMSTPADPPREPGKPSILQSTLMRVILDKARNADEAVELVRQFNVYFVDTREHLMIGDAGGRFRVVEFIDGTVRVTAPEGSWQVCTNHILWNRTEEENDQLCPRYQTGSGLAAHFGLSVTAADAELITGRMSVPATMWSSLYTLTTGEVSVFYKANRATGHHDAVGMAR